MNKQAKRPLFDALITYANSGVTPFDVPGHKMGAGAHEDLLSAFGAAAVRMDINSSPTMDILSNPEGVILEAERLAAELFHADHAFFLVNGSTSGIQSMMLATLKPGDTIIVPRNIHKSAINGLVLTGARPVYMAPTVEPTLGISVGHAVQTALQAMDAHPEAKAILLLNPTYYGFTADITTIIKEAKQRDLFVLVDESHGTHFTFDQRFGVPAMMAGADMATISVHKTGGSFTQSSMLLLNEGRLTRNKVQSAINVMQTSSASYLLMASLDIARHNLAMHPERIAQVHALATRAHHAIETIPGLRVMDRTMWIDGERFHHDVSKLLIDVHQLGLTGTEVMQILFEQYNLQMEVGETNVILAVISLGDTDQSIDRLIDALTDLAQTHYKGHDIAPLPRQQFEHMTKLRPREAFFAATEYIDITTAEGRIAGDQIMIYPPGIPLLVPGEIITAPIIDEYIRLIEQGNKVIGSYANGAIRIKVIKEDQQ